MSNLSNINEMQNSKQNGSAPQQAEVKIEPQPLTIEGATLAHVLRKLAEKGYGFEVKDDAGGVIIKVTGLRTAKSVNGKLVFAGIESGDIKESQALPAVIAPAVAPEQQRPDGGQS